MKEIIRKENSQTVGAEYHEKRNSSAAILRKLAEDPTHQANWETPYYTKFLDKCLEGTDLSEKVCLDLGCGDGRFTEYLIKKGAKKVICLDSHYEPLRNLQIYSSEQGWENKIELICGGAEKIPLENESVDIILALGIFYYLGDLYQEGISESYHKLKEGGILISSEPDLEGIALRSLFLEGLEEMLENFYSKTFKEQGGETKYRFPIYKEEEILDFYKKAGFHLEEKKGLSIFHQLIRIMYVKQEISKEILEKKLEDIKQFFDYLDEKGKFNKTNIYKHRK